MERLAAWLSYSQLPVVSQFFASPRSLLEAHPDVQADIIDRCERRIYGLLGLSAYESAEPSRTRRLAHRSLAQFLASRAQITRARRTLRSLAFAVVLPIALAMWVVRSWHRRGGAQTRWMSGTVVFFWADRLDKFVWDGMFGETPFLLHREQQLHLGSNELRFFVRAVAGCPRMLCYPDFVANFLRWLGYYGFVVRHYRPSRIAHFLESTPSSSLMTAYLAEKGIAHCDIQHGEVVFSAHCAFAEFDEYRVWGEHFRDVFVRQRSPAGAIRVVGVPFHRHLFHRIRPSQQPRPRRLLIIDPFLHALEWNHDHYFLRMLRSLGDGWEIVVRRHPADRQPRLRHVERWNSDASLAQRGIRVSEEPPDALPIDDALGRSRVVAGVSSAALLEAWIAGCKVVYVPGGPARSAVMDRHGGSPNVCYLDDAIDLERFLETPASLDVAEARRVNYLTSVLDES